METLQLSKLVDEKAQINFFKSLTKVEDIYYYDGPLLSLFISNENENYIYYWVDVDDTYNRWLIFKIDSKDLELCYKQEKDIKTLIVNPIDFIYCADIDNDLEYNNVGIIYSQNLPELYLPEEDCFFENDKKFRNITYTI